MNSPRFSMAGWNWRIWLRKQKTYVKTVFALTCAYVVAVTAKVPDPQLQAALVGFVGLLTRGLADALDYWLNDVPPADPTPG